MKKSLILVLLISLLVLTIVGCSENDSNLIEKTVVVLNSSGYGLTEITLTVGTLFDEEYESRRPEDTPPDPIFLENGQNIEYTQLYDKRKTQYGQILVIVKGTVSGSRKTSDNYAYLFTVDSEEDIELTVTYSINQDKFIIAANGPVIVEP